MIVCFFYMFDVRHTAHIFLPYAPAVKKTPDIRFVGATTKTRYESEIRFAIQLMVVPFYLILFFFYNPK